MKKITSILFTIVLVVSSFTIAGTNTKADVQNWAETAITAPKMESLVGAGYIDIVFNMTLSGARSYEVYFDGVSKETYNADALMTSAKCEVYTTGVSAHNVYVEATMNDNSKVKTTTLTFYVSKKGLAMGGDMSSVVQMRKMNLSWYYNWATTAFNSSVDEDIVHVPMVWGAEQENIDDIANITDDSNYILGYNEPDIASQANLTPAEGLLAWPYVQATGKRTVSPAASNPNGSSKWLTDFLAGTDVDAVALHCYGGSTKIENLLSAVDNIWNAYHKPVWVTEVSVMGRKGTSYDNSYENVEARKKVEEYVEKLVAELDKRSYVERYAWFPYNINSENEIDDMNGSGASAMFDYDTGKFTDLGVIYSEAGNPEGYKVIKILESEKYKEEEATTKTEINETTTKLIETTTQALVTTREILTPAVKTPARVKIKQVQNNKKKSVSLKWLKSTNAKKYQIQYSLNKKFKKAKKYKTRIIKTSKLTYTVKKLTKKKTYYFRVRGIAGKISGTWSDIRKVKIKK